MTLSVSVLKKKLDKYTDVNALREEDKNRCCEILKHIEKAKKTHGNYIASIKKDFRPRVSIRHLLAIIKWLKEKGYLGEEKGRKRQKLLVLTEKGREALRILTDYFYSPLEKTDLRISLNFGEEVEVEASLSGDLRDADELAVFSNSFIRDKILELSAALSYSSKYLSLTIKVPIVEDKAIYVLLKILWSFYWQTLRKTRLNPIGPLYIDMHLTGEEYKKTYTGFWRKQLDKVLRFEHIKLYERFRTSDVKTVKTEEREFVPLLPEPLENILPVYTKREKIKQWIESQLEKEADWFMPHYFWVKLGFKQRREDLSTDSMKNVSPPFFFRISKPIVTETYRQLESVFKLITQEHLANYAICISMLKRLNLNSEELYESWRILRKLHGYEIWYLKDVVKILDEALFEYIVANRPNVNLNSAFDDYLVSKDADIVVKGIREGKYRLNTYSPTNLSF